MNTLKSMAVVATVVVLLTGSRPAQASLAVTDFRTSDSITYTGSGTGSQVIPDNNPSGVAYSLNFAATGLSISDISVMLQLSGGYNGDITAYLSHGSGISYLLEANPAVSSSGLNITLVQGMGNPIPTGGSGTLTGSSYTASTDLATFDNTDPNGDWTIFFADLGPGDTSTLTGFSINIMVVPEPDNVTLVIFGMMLLVGTAVSRRIKKNCRS